MTSITYCHDGVIEIISTFSLKSETFLKCRLSDIANQGVQEFPYKRHGMIRFPGQCIGKNLRQFGSLPELSRQSLDYKDTKVVQVRVQNARERSWNKIPT